MSQILSSKPWELTQVRALPLRPSQPEWLELERKLNEKIGEVWGNQWALVLRDGEERDEPVVGRGSFDLIDLEMYLGIASWESITLTWNKPYLHVESLHEGVRREDKFLWITPTQLKLASAIEALCAGETARNRLAGALEEHTALLCTAMLTRENVERYDPEHPEREMVAHESLIEQGVALMEPLTPAERAIAAGLAREWEGPWEELAALAHHCMVGSG